MSATAEAWSPWQAAEEFVCLRPGRAFGQVLKASEMVLKRGRRRYHGLRVVSFEVAMSNSDRDAGRENADLPCVRVDALVIQR